MEVVKKQDVLDALARQYGADSDDPKAAIVRAWDEIKKKVFEVSDEDWPN
jgi:uncharacterized protein YecA (UPF0149 family)